MSGQPDRAPVWSDYVRSPNITDHPDVYERENEAFDPPGLVLDAMARLAPWAGRVLVDLGCGTGFWLPGYAATAAHVVGVEPEPRLADRARRRTRGLARVEVRDGSAAHLPLGDASVDVVHARFAYFFGPGAEPGLAEVMRVLRPGGALVVVDNDWRRGEFAELLQAGYVGPGRVDPDAVDRWWDAVGAERVDVMSSWGLRSPRDLAAVLRIEFPREVADGWLRAHRGRTSLSYGYVVRCVRR